MQIDVEKLVPENWNVELIDQKRVKVYYKTQGRGNSPRPLILPKQINIDKEFMEALSMYIGDGKLSPDKFHLEFTSKDMDMIKFMLAFFQKRFNFKISEMQYTLTYKQQPKEIFVSQLAKDLVIPKNLINLKQSDRYKEPCFDIQIGSKIFRKIFGDIINLILSTDFSNDTTLRRAFLRGLFASEGGIGIQSTENYLAYIAFHLSYEKEKDLANFVRNLLIMEKIKSKHLTRKKKGERSVQITGWENYWKAFKIDLFSLNRRKKEKFIKYLKSRTFYCQISAKLKDIILNKTNQRRLAIFLNKNYYTFYGNFKRDSIKITDLVKLVESKNLTVEEIKENIISIKTRGNSKPIKDRDLINYVFQIDI